MKYLNPKADLTFKCILGEHPDLTISFLNALLPLHPEKKITEIEYLPSEMMPKNPLRKVSIVDVCCTDKAGRQFFVEMQMIWSSEFESRVSFNASEAYVRQMKLGEEYELSQPVYSLNLSDVIYRPELEGYYHHYDKVYVEQTGKVIDGLHLILVELPKFTSSSEEEEKMKTFWLRYLIEIEDNAPEVPNDLLAIPEIKKAVMALEQSAFTEAQLLGYEKFWDIISVEKTLYNSAIRRGERRGREEGRQEGILAMARGMKIKGIDLQTIAEISGLTLQEIEKL